MYIIVASEVDDTAKELIPYFPKGTARILTPADLSKPGWRIHTSDPGNSICVAGGEPLCSSGINGVLCLLPCVFGPELVQIEEEARDYVASEMTAFLKFWLFSLSCPMLSPPSAGCLSGPNWRREQWAGAARDAGLPISPFMRRTSPQCPTDKNGEQMVTVTLIGNKASGENESGLTDQVKDLAKVAGVNLLQVTFMKTKRDNSYLFYGANTFPALQGAGTTQLIMDFFNGG